MIFHRVLSRAAAVLVVPALLFTGCAGYTFGPIKPARLANVKSIAVPTFKNMTLEPRSSVLVTNEVIKRIQREVLADGRARGSSNIFLDENFQLTERQSLNEAASEAARDLVTRLSEGIPGQTGVATGRDILGNRRSSSF